MSEPPDRCIEWEKALANNAAEEAIKYGLKRIDGKWYGECYEYNGIRFVIGRNDNHPDKMFVDLLDSFGNTIKARHEYQVSSYEEIPKILPAYEEYEKLICSTRTSHE